MSSLIKKPDRRVWFFEEPSFPVQWFFRVFPLLKAVPIKTMTLLELQWLYSIPCTRRRFAPSVQGCAFRSPFLSVLYSFQRSVPAYAVLPSWTFLNWRDPRLNLNVSTNSNIVKGRIPIFSTIKNSRSRSSALLEWRPLGRYRGNTLKGVIPRFQAAPLYHK